MPGLDVGVDSFFFETAGAKIDEFDLQAVIIDEQNILRFDVAVDYFQPLQVVERKQNLRYKDPDRVQRKALVLIQFSELEQVQSEQLEAHADMLPKNDEVLDLNDIGVFVEV